MMCVFDRLISQLADVNIQSSVGMSTFIMYYIRLLYI